MQGHHMQDATQSPAKAIVNADIVPLKPSDFTIASEYLAAAFSQDPMMGYFLPEETAAKKRALRHSSQSFLNFAQLYGHVYTTADDPKGVAIWLPPEAFQISLRQLWQVLTSGLIISPLYMRWSRIQEFLAFLNTQIQMHDQLSPEPHWYLGMLGVSPKCQGQGIGGRLLQPILEESDRTKMPCYLETTTPGAVRFYQRHGFEVIHQGMFADRQYWSMKRYPQSLS